MERKKCKKTKQKQKKKHQTNQGPFVVAGIRGTIPIKRLAALNVPGGWRKRERVRIPSANVPTRGRRGTTNVMHIIKFTALGMK